MNNNLDLLKENKNPLLLLFLFALLLHTLLANFLWAPLGSFGLLWAPLGFSSCCSPNQSLKDDFDYKNCLLLTRNYIDKNILVLKF